MAKLMIHGSCMVVCCGVKAIVLKSDLDCKSTVIDIPTTSPCVKKGVDQNEDIKRSAEDLKYGIVTGDVSVSGKYVVLCTSSKLVTLWETSTWTLISNRVSHRVASKVKFIPSEESVVLADKSGDAYEFSVTFPQQEGKFLLGHLSMLLDVLVTPDKRYLITCDRDEKIRVSCYPNAYNINSYCLGHREFVTRIFLLPHDETILVSAAGDGILKFWDYVLGNQVHQIETYCDYHHFDNINLKEVNDTNPLAVRLSTSCVIAPNTSVICCCLLNVCGCLVYYVDGRKNLQHKCIQVIRLKEEPWDILLLDTHLWILGPSDEQILLVFVWDLEKLQFRICTDERITSITTEVNKKRDLFKNIVSSSLTLLYKRRFDNVQEYQERKKQRLAGTQASSHSDMCTN